jgi:hypothetical protein
VLRSIEAIFGLRAKHHGEVLAHCITRAAFLRHVSADARTRELFIRWRRESKLDLVVTEWQRELDTAAARAGLAHRSALHHDAAAYDALPFWTRKYIAELEWLRQLRRGRTLDVRAGQAAEFATVILTPAPGLRACRAWLATDLLHIFDAEILRDLWGEPDVHLDVSAGPLGEVPRGQRPMHQGAHLERDAAWCYRRHVQVPRAKLGELAREHRDAQRPVRSALELRLA